MIAGISGFYVAELIWGIFVIPRSIVPETGACSGICHVTAGKVANLISGATCLMYRARWMAKANNAANAKTTPLDIVNPATSQSRTSRS